MTFLKKLLFGGFPAAGAVSLSAASYIRSGDEEGVEAGLIETNQTDSNILLALLRKAGLNCEGVVEGSKCGINTRKGIKVDKNSTKESGLYFFSGGKIVLHKSDSNVYKNGLRLTVEGGDIQLNKWSGETTGIPKLERYESYGLEKVDEEIYLTLKRTTEQGKMMALGLPISCTLPAKEGSTTTCEVPNNQIKNVHFDGKKRGGATIGGTNDKKITLKISKTSDSTHFTDGYKFSLVPEEDLTISSDNVVKKKTETEFKVREWNKDSMSLERAWSLDVLIKLVGLSCDSSGECTIVGGSLKVKQDNNTLKGGNKTGGEGKIKLYKNQEKHENGFRFAIEGDDISISGTGTGITKLGRYESYEIAKSGEEYYLNRRHESVEEILNLLGLGVPCNLKNRYEKKLFDDRNQFECTIRKDDFRGIKFEETQSPGTTINSNGKSAKLTIEKTTESETFKYGYKFLFKPEGEITISSTNKLKANVSTTFKIKEENSTLTLERAVKPDDLIKFVGLSCSGSSGNEICSFIDSQKINVTQGHLSLTDATPTTGQGVGTLKLVNRNDADYNEGLKFEVVNGDISLNGGQLSDGENKNVRLGEFDTYEINEKGGRWYLHQKKNFMQIKHNAVGIPGNCNNAFSTHCTIGGISANSLNFKEKKTHSTKSQYSNEAKIQLLLHRDSMYNFGIKVTMKVVGGDDSRHVSIVCKDYDLKTLFKVAKEELEFRIEKDNGNNNKFLLVRQGDTPISGLANDCTIPSSDN